MHSTERWRLASSAARSSTTPTVAASLDASRAFRSRLDAVGVAWSMGAKGCCYHNACVESFFATLKEELVYKIDLHAIDDTRAHLSAYINLFYNSRRRHSALGYLSPASFEANHHQHQPDAARAA